MAAAVSGRRAFVVGLVGALAWALLFRLLGLG